MRKSKWQLLAISLGVLLFALLCGQGDSSGFYMTSLLIVSLFFAALAGRKFYRDYKLSLGQPPIREVRAHYDEPPEQMSRGSRGLPTNFD